MKFTLTSSEICKALDISPQRLSQYRNGSGSKNRTIKHGTHFIKTDSGIWKYSESTIKRLRNKVVKRKRNNTK